jgi:hypothetical protein
MGTSTDFSGGTGGAWTGFKRAATDYAKRGGEGLARRVMARHVGTLGGAGAAVGSATAGVSTAQRLARMLADIGTTGFDAALRTYGLERLIGRDRFDVLEALIEVIAPPGADLESEAARSAAFDVIGEIFAEGESYEELARAELDRDGVLRALELFIAWYVYNRADPVIEQRLSRLDSGEAERRNRELVDYLRQLVRLELGERDPFAVAWDEPEGRALIEGLLHDVYRQLEAWDE